MLRLLLLLIAGALPATAEIQFGVIPVRGRTEMASDWKPLTDYLTQVVGEKITLHIAPDYGSLRREMESGAVDLGSFSPFAYVDATRGHKIRLIAQAMHGGVAWYRGVIVATKASGITSVDGLRGKRFAFVDRKSASGYVYPRAMLIGDGFDPDHFFAATLFAGDHQKVIAALIGGEADGGAVFDRAVYDPSGRQDPRFTVLATTEPIPFEAIAVRTALDAAVARRLQTALVTASRSETGRKALALNSQGISGFALATDGTFNGVRRTAGAAGL